MSEQSLPSNVSDSPGVSTTDRGAAAAPATGDTPAASAAPEAATDAAATAAADNPQTEAAPAPGDSGDEVSAAEGDAATGEGEAAAGDKPGRRRRREGRGEGAREGREGREGREPREAKPEDPRAVLPNLALEFAGLVRLATKYPEIGPPVAELAFKTGYGDFGKQILSVALGGEAPGLEYYAVAARQAKHEGQHQEALDLVMAAVKAVAAAPERYTDVDDVPKLLHLVRLGFTVLLFELKDPNGAPSFTGGLAQELPKLGEHLAKDPFYHSLVAQTLWYSDKAASERAWDLAGELGEPEFTFNARGTWYKEAERDPGKAERAYRAGIERAPHSPLLRHNLAQLLLLRAQANRDRDEVAWPTLQEADGLIRGALNGDCAKGLRRHIHATRAEIIALRNELRPRRGGEERGERPERYEPRVDEEKLAALEIGQTVKGKVKSLATYGAFVALDGGIVGLMHRTEIAHEHVADPAQVLQVGQEIEVKVIELNKQEPQRPRIGLSRKALLPAPPARGGRGPNDRRGPGQAGGRGNEGRADNRGGGNQGRGGEGRGGGESRGNEGRVDARGGGENRGNEGRVDNRGGGENRGNEGRADNRGGGENRGNEQRVDNRGGENRGGGEHRGGGERRDRGPSDRGPDNRDRAPSDRGPDNRDRGPSDRGPDNRGPGGPGGRGGKGEAPGSFKFPSLGEMLLAKLREQENKS